MLRRGLCYTFVHGLLSMKEQMLSVSKDVYAAASRRLAEFGYRRGNKTPGWDEELFDEAYSHLVGEYVRADKRERRNILIARYFDALHTYEVPAASHFLQTHVIDLPSRSVRYDDRIPGVQYDNILATLDPQSRQRTLDVRGTIYQYGPSRIFELPPGQWIDVSSMEEQDIVGTSHVTACSVVIAHASQRIFMAHVRMSNLDQIRAMVLFAKERFLNEVKVSLVYPQRGIPIYSRMSGEDRDEAERRAIDERLKWKDFCKDVKVASLAIPYIEHGYNPDEVESYSVIVGGHFLSVMGVDYSYHGMVDYRHLRRALPKMETEQTVLF